MKKSNKRNTVKTQHTPAYTPAYTPAPWGMELIESGEYSSDWRISHTFNPGTFGPGSPSIKHRICDVPHTWTAQGLADVRLICAAPELLEALSAIYNSADEETQEVWSQARAAIAKATGGMI
jgi:hypothetical protein